MAFFQAIPPSTSVSSGQGQGPSAYRAHTDQTLGALFSPTRGNWLDPCISRWCPTFELTWAMLSPPLCPESPSNLRTRRDGAKRRTHTRRYHPELGKTRRARGRSVWYVLVWLQFGSSKPRPSDIRQYPPRRLRSTKAQVRPTAGGYAAPPWRRSPQLRPRPTGTRERCTAQTCYTPFGIDL